MTVALISVLFALAKMMSQNGPFASYSPDAKIRNISMFCRLKQCFKLDADEEWPYSDVHHANRLYSLGAPESDGKTSRVTSAVESHDSFPVSISRASWALCSVHAIGQCDH